MSRKRSEINQATLRYICACCHDNDWRSLQDTGFGRSEIDALRNLSFDEIRILEREVEGLNFARVRADRDVFWEAMNRTRSKFGVLRTRDELISRNAPADMMKELYGIGTKEYTRLRRALNVSTGVGRPVVIDEAAAFKICTAWRAICPISSHFKHINPKHLIGLSDETGIDIRAIWGLIKQYLSNPAKPSNSPSDSPVNNDAKKDELSSNSRRRSA